MKYSKATDYTLHKKDY